ncbi:MAG TPA: metallophosphoesterase family protein [Chryseolinea sp.]|nr:metallophosphoesterase family protein [Chryseolinea sp.]
MKIGLLSDTHSYLDPKVFTHFIGCDEIWHAGDIGDTAIATELKSFKPLRAVFGNIDNKELQSKFPEDLKFKCEGINVFITHIGGTPPKYNHRVMPLLKEYGPDLFICGHSHILCIKRDPQLNNMLFVNPGAAGNHGFHRMKTLVRFRVDDKKISNMEVIELGKRGSIPASEPVA